MSGDDLMARAMEVIKKADKDGDGKLDLDEMVAFGGDHFSPEELKKKLDQFDRDGDKRLSPPELAEVLKSLHRKERPRTNLPARQGVSWFGVRAAVGDLGDGRPYLKGNFIPSPLSSSQFSTCSPHGWAHRRCVGRAPSTSKR